MRRSYVVSKDALSSLVEGIDPKLIIRLLRKWGYEAGSGSRKISNVKLIQNHVGRSISNEQLEELWLLREQYVTFKRLGWRLFKLDRKIRKTSPKMLEARLNSLLKKEGLARSVKCRACNLDKRNLQYVGFAFKERDGVFESWKSKFEIYKPVWRIRCILDYDHYVLRINGEEGSLEVVLNILGKALRISPISIKLPPYILKELTEEDHVTRIVLFSSTEVSGTKGVGRIALEGDDVMRGVEELRARQEIDLSKLGVLFEVETKSLRANVEGVVWAKDEDQISHFLEKVVEKG
ncbi:MAG: hypothetical protein ACFE7E_03635 [Candidatus Hodarchaeota archaeon]